MPRGIATKTPERVAEAKQLREGGWILKDIAARLGVSVKTIDTWLHDPDGERHRARKDSYRRPCPECGAPMSGGNGKDREPQRCAACVTVWTPEAIIAAIHEWVEEHAGVPPRSLDWDGTDRWPSHDTVHRVFGTWNAGLIAAGFEPHRVMGRTPDLDTLITQIRAGERVVDMAERYGVVPTAINQRFKYAGLRIRDFRPKARP